MNVTLHAAAPPRNDSSGGSVLGPTWASSQALSGAAPAHVSRIFAAAFFVLHPRRHRELPRRHQALAAQQVDPRVVLGVAARRRLQLVAGAHRVALLHERGGDPLDLGARGVGVDGGPEALQLVLGHHVVPDADHHPVRPEVEVVARRRPRPRRTRPGGSCTAAVLAEAQVVVRPEDVERPEVGELGAELLHRRLHGTLERRLVGLPERLAVVGLELLVELERRRREARERHRPNGSQTAHYLVPDA